MRAGRFGLSDAGDLNAILDSKHADTWMVPSNYPGLQKSYCVIRPGFNSYLELAGHLS